MKSWTPSFSLEDFAEEDHGQFKVNFADEDGRRATGGGKATREGEEK